MPSVLQISLLIILFLIILIICTIIFHYLKKIYLHNKMLKSTIKLLHSDNLNTKNNLRKNVISKVKNESYDLYYETIRFHIYIKLINNYNKDPLYINNKYQWVIKGSKKNKIIDINSFIDFKSDVKDKKEIIKLVIVYPNASALLKYVNEVELDIIYPNKDLYGVYVLTYETIFNDKTIINKK